MSSGRQKLVLIDAMALIHRAFHAIPPLTTRHGELTNAVFGFTSTVLTTVAELRPDYIAVSFDLPEPTFRHEKYAEYKATRQKAPDELRSQFGRVRDVVNVLGIPVYEKAGYEADDVIGALAKQVSAEHDLDVYIVTGDRDSLQLVDDKVKVYMLKWRPGGRETVVYDPAKLKKDTGLTAEEFVDYKALLGDSSDNIPGVPGIGEKTANALVAEYGSLEGLYKALEEDRAAHPLIKPRVRENLGTYRDQAYLSRELSRIVTDIPLEFDLAGTTIHDFDRARAERLFSELEFTSLLGRLNDFGKVAAQETGGEAPKPEAHQTTEPYWEGRDYRLVATPDDLAKFLRELRQQETFAFGVESGDPLSPAAVGLAFSWQEGQAFYLPLGHAVGSNLEPTPTLELLKPVFTDPARRKVAHDLKHHYKALATYGIATQGLEFDTLLGSYLLNPGARTLKLDKLAFQELGYQMPDGAELLGTGRARKSPTDLDAEAIANYEADAAEATWRLYQKLSQELHDTGLAKVLEGIELPLVPVLAEMERHGVKVDTAVLEKMSRRFEKELNKLEKDVCGQAGCEFNLNSPSQLAKVLFDDLRIGAGTTRRGSKHKTTAAGELEKYKDAHPIVPLILRYRELSKLKTTYLDALPKLVREDGRVHTSYGQAVAATGRLNSSDPNLQNIPIRTGLGREMRQAFVTDPGFKLLAADYSQFELRIAAHISGDERLQQAFREGRDIHTATAALLAGVAPEDVAPEQRYAAKAVNFSILYGATPHGVARSTGMSVAEAAEYIARYFQTYPKLREYMDSMVAKAQTDGYVETLFGRRRYLPEIHASVYPLREAAKRMAINMPIQGTQADILKQAMIAIHRDLPAQSADARMILTVHDELVFELPKDDVERTGKWIVEQMEHAYELSVPIVVDARFGDNWDAMEPLRIA